MNTSTSTFIRVIRCFERIRRVCQCFWKHEHISECCKFGLFTHWIRLPFSRFPQKLHHINSSRLYSITKCLLGIFLSRNLWNGDHGGSYCRKWWISIVVNTVCRVPIARQCFDVPSVEGSARRVFVWLLLNLDIYNVFLCSCFVTEMRLFGGSFT